MKKTLLIAATLLTAVSILNIGWWLYNASRADSFEKAVNNYLNVFPSVLQNGRLIAKLSLVPLVLSFSSLIYLISKQYKLVISITICVICSIIFIWTVWSLM